MATSTGNTQWHAPYWNAEKHGNAWDRAKEALKRDWSQTKADLHVDSGKKLRQGAGDTVKQAAGKEPLPAPNQPNPPDFNKVEPAVSYGVGAREEYGQQFTAWDDTLETKLSKEWDPTKTGMKFDDVKPYVRRGWEHGRK